MGFLPVFFPPQRCLGQAAVHAQPGPVDPFPLVVGQQACLPQALEDPRLDPLLEAVMRGGTRAKARGVQSLPLTARAQDKKNGLHANSVRRARLAATKPMGVHMFGDLQGDRLP